MCVRKRLFVVVLMSTTFIIEEQFVAIEGPKSYYLAIADKTECILA